MSEKYPNNLSFFETNHSEQVNFAIDPDKLESIKQMYDGSSIYFNPTENSKIGDPELFLSQIEQVQCAVFPDRIRPSSRRNGDALRLIVDLTQDISNKENEKKMAHSAHGIHDPDQFRAVRQAEIEYIAEQRKNIYRGLFGFDKLISHKVITEDEFREIINGDIYNLVLLLQDEHEPNFLDNEKVIRYKHKIEEYVADREIK